MGPARLWWYDDDPSKPLEQKVAEAAWRYKAKFGRVAEACEVHPSMLAGGEQRVAGVAVVARGHVLRHHFAVGPME